MQMLLDKFLGDSKRAFLVHPVLGQGWVVLSAAFAITAAVERALLLGNAFGLGVEAAIAVASTSRVVAA